MASFPSVDPTDRSETVEWRRQRSHHRAFLKESHLDIKSQIRNPSKQMVPNSPRDSRTKGKWVEIYNPRTKEAPWRTSACLKSDYRHYLAFRAVGTFDTRPRSLPFFRRRQLSVLRAASLQHAKLFGRDDDVHSIAKRGVKDFLPRPDSAKSANTTMRLLRLLFAQSGEKFSPYSRCSVAHGSIIDTREC